MGRLERSRTHPQATKTCCQSHNRLAIQNAQHPTLRTASLAVTAWPCHVQESATSDQWRTWLRITCVIFSNRYKRSHPVIHAQMPEVTCTFHEPELTILIICGINIYIYIDTAYYTHIFYFSFQSYMFLFLLTTLRKIKCTHFIRLLWIKNVYYYYYYKHSA